MNICHSIVIIMMMISLCGAVGECSTAPPCCHQLPTLTSGRGLDQNNNQRPRTFRSCLDFSQLAPDPSFPSCLGRTEEERVRIWDLGGWYGAINIRRGV